MREIVLHLSAKDNGVTNELIEDLQRVVDESGFIALSTTRGQYLGLELDAIEADA